MVLHLCQSRRLTRLIQSEWKRRLKRHGRGLEAFRRLFRGPAVWNHSLNSSYGPLLIDSCSEHAKRLSWSWASHELRMSTRGERVCLQTCREEVHVCDFYYRNHNSALTPQRTTASFLLPRPSKREPKYEGGQKVTDWKWVGGECRADGRQRIALCGDECLQTWVPLKHNVAFYPLIRPGLSRDRTTAKTIFHLPVRRLWNSGHGLKASLICTFHFFSSTDNRSPVFLITHASSDQFRHKKNKHTDK